MCSNYDGVQTMSRPPSNGDRVRVHAYVGTESAEFLSLRGKFTILNGDKIETSVFQFEHIVDGVIYVCTRADVISTDVWIVSTETKPPTTMPFPSVEAAIVALQLGIRP